MTKRATARHQTNSPDPERARSVLATLEETYGSHTWKSHGPPLDELIGTILSQNTSNTNTARSFRSLRESFDDWEDVRTAPVGAVADAIRSGGLAQIKAPRIQSVLDAILERNGSLSLDHLRDMPVPEATAEMTAMRGVGPKTAACVLLFSLGQPAMPVDTHVHRLSLRTGMVPPKTTPERCQRVLEDVIGPDRDRILTAHLNLIRHGQRVCRAQHPACGECPVRDRCDYGRARGAAEPAGG